MTRWSAVLALLLATTSCERAGDADPLAGNTWVDLSYDLAGDTIYWPTAKPFELNVESAGRTPAGYYYAANNFSASEHGGTHLDAPLHFAEGKWSTDQIPLERLIGPAVVIDVAADSAKDADYQITPAVLEAWERENGALPDGAIVLFRTGWGSRWPDRTKYLGTATLGSEGVAELHFPGIHPDAARWLVAHGSIDAVGIDTASIDYGQSTRFESHRELFEREIPAFENLTALDRLPPVGAFVIALPMKIGGGSGGPVRAVAILP